MLWLGVWFRNITVVEVKECDVKELRQLLNKIEESEL